MFNFFRRGKTAGKHEDGGTTAGDNARTPPNDRNSTATSQRTDKRHDVAPIDRPAHATLTRKDVVNLLIPPQDYGAQKTGVGAIFQSIMAGNRRRNRNKHKNRHKNQNAITRAESYKEISTGLPEEMQPNGVSLYRSHSQLDKTFLQKDDALSAPVSACDLTCDAIPAFDSKNNSANAARAPPSNDADPASFVKELVLQKYRNKSPVQPKRQHVSLVYVSNEPQVEKVALPNGVVDRQHADSLLRETARINGDLNDIEPMGASDSKSDDERRHQERRNYAKVENEAKNDSMTTLKDNLKNELEKLLQNDKPQNEPKPEVQQPETFFTEIEYEPEQISLEEKDDDKISINTDIEETKSIESPGYIKKSNLKPPRSDTEGCSDDDRSECGKKKVTFRKTIDFDDGDQQTDEEVDSSFESLASSEAEETEDEEDDEIPDNDELLGGVVVARIDDKMNSDEDENLPTSITEINEEPDLYEKQRLKRETEASDIFSDRIEISELRDCETKEQNDKCDSSIDEIQRINSDNSDSGFLEFSEKVGEEARVTEPSVTDSESEEEEIEVSDSEEIVSEEEEIIAEIIDADLDKAKLKSLVTQEDALTVQVAQLSELANSRSGEAERARDLLSTYRKEIESRDNEIERLKADLAAAYKESELLRQRSRSLEDDLSAARSCSADLAGKLSAYSDDTERSLRQQLDDAQVRAAKLDSRVASLERDRSRLEGERHAHEQKALEAVAAAEASSARWKAAHEAARSQATARAERLLADCEWKMRELEKRARDAEKQNCELSAALQKAQTVTPPSASLQAELQQLRGLASEHQRSAQALSGQLQRLEGREDALKLEVQRLKELLDKEAQAQREKEDTHFQTVSRLCAAHTKRIEVVRAELHAQHTATRAALERAHAERTRAALAQLRAEQERDARNHERKMREAHSRFDNLKETLATKEAQFEEAIAEANSKADWELLQLRHLLDRSDITYANNLEKCTERHEKECERLNAEWSTRLRETEEAAATAAGEARTLLEKTRSRMESERQEQLSRLKEQHKNEMDLQWERFMQDKEACLARMKLECLQEGEEERTRREKDMLDEIAELKAAIASKSTSFEDLSNKAAACGRTLAVTEQELREALEREKELRMQRSEDAEKIKQAKAASKDEVEHLTRKCACLRKLFDDMRTRLAQREKSSAEESRLQQREIQQLKAEVARLTKILIEQSSPKLGARTRADGCDFAPTAPEAESFFCEAGPQVCESQPCAPRRKGGTLRTPELPRRRSTIPEPLRPLNLTDLKPVKQDGGAGRRRAKSVDLPAVQVPERIRQLEDRNK